ncbi:MAG: hypothetical protein J6A83_02620 [Clostridia bacterium]|nr:hypothetical protein [Clostridia bacterium]
MKYTENYKVKWHDTDAARRVRPSDILVYMQETANLQLQNSGNSLDKMRDEQGLAFILSKIKLIFHAPLHAYDEISARTWTCESRGYTFLRCFDIYRGDELIAEGISFWALVDLNTRRFVRADGFSLGVESDEPLAIDVPRRIKPPADEVAVLGERVIRYSDIDYNMHMNNTKYPNMLCDFMPIEKVGNIREMTLEFLHESALGDTLTFQGACADGRYYFKTVNTAGEVCLTAEVVVEE